MSTWFYWQRSVTCRWSPVKADRQPGKPMHGGWTGETKGLVKLPVDQEGCSLAQLASFYPLDEPSSAVPVDAPTPQAPAVPAAEAPRRSMAELAEETAQAESKWLGAAITHVKSGDEYVIRGVHHREFDMALSIEYTPRGGEWEGYVNFARSVDEMAFGTRFVFSGDHVDGVPT